MIGRLAIAAAAAATLAGPARAACDRAAFTVLLDAGHSPSSPGAISARGRTEHRFNLALTARVEAALKARGFIRTMRLGARAAALGAPARGASIGASKADVVLSIHHDSVQPRYLEPWTFGGRPLLFSDRFAGWSIFIAQDKPLAAQNLAFARLLADALRARGLPFTRHHAEPIPGESRPWADAARGVHRFDALAVLRAAQAPAALLEAGVIVNRAEEAALETAARRNAIAAAAADAVDRFCAAL